MTDIELLDERDEVTQGFTVDTMEKADWAIRKKGSAQAEIDRIEQYAAALKHRIDARVAEITKVHRNTLEAMDEMLRPWATTEVAKANGRKSVKLISGTVGFRQSPSRLEVTDEDAAIEWMEAHFASDCLRVKKEVNKTALKKRIEADGEIPDGCELKAGEVRFYAEPIVPALESKPAT